MLIICHAYPVINRLIDQPRPPPLPPTPPPSPPPNGGKTVSQSENMYKYKYQVSTILAAFPVTSFSFRLIMGS
jgi:hypothetical protein